MPFSAPGSLSDNDVYAVVAYILSEAKIIKPTDTMNATTLPKVVMPNRDGFIPDARPELELYRRPEQSLTAAAAFGGKADTVVVRWRGS